jgi:DNA primase
MGVAAPSQWQLGAIRSRRRRPVAIARPVYRATVGWTLAASGNPAGGAALANDWLERLDFTYHPCLGLDRDPPYSAVGGEQSMNRQPLDELKQQIPLLDYLEAHHWRPVRRLSRGRWMGLCPLHNDHKPSFLMDPSQNLFYCYGCGRGGDVIRFAELYHQVKFPQALALLRQWRGWAPLLHQAVSFYHMQLHRRVEAVAYLQQRGIRSPELIEHMRIGYAPGGSCLRRWLTQLGYPFPALRQAGLVTAIGYDAYMHRIVFPLEGNLYGRSLSASAPPHRFLPGAKGGLYLWERVRQYQDVILVEGLFDYAVLWQAGFHNVTCSMGNHLNAYQFRQLCDGRRTVYLAFDTDSNGSGQQAAQALACRLREQGLNARRVRLPDGHDPNSFFVQGGDAPQFQLLLEEARA